MKMQIRRYTEDIAEIIVPSFKVFIPVVYAENPEYICRAIDDFIRARLDEEIKTRP